MRRWRRGNLMERLNRVMGGQSRERQVMKRQNGLMERYASQRRR